MTYYLIFIWGDVSSELMGPFKTEKKRDKKALDLRRREGDEHGIHMLTIDKYGIPTVSDYSGGFFAEVSGR